MCRAFFHLLLPEKERRELTNGGDGMGGEGSRGRGGVGRKYTEEQRRTNGGAVVTNCKLIGRIYISQGS